jgi:23S rRNA-/tRNA-specific pseudouridylate synthase
LLKLQPHTGRKRQLRKHCHFDLGCTMVGEKLHQIDEAIKKGSEKQSELEEKSRKLRQRMATSVEMNGGTPLFLHASSVTLCHPLLHSGKPLTVRAPQPKIFQAAMEALRGSEGRASQ